MNWKRKPWLLALLVVGACATTTELTPKSAAVPGGVDLSGRWQIRDDDGRAARQISRAGADAVGRDIDIPRRADVDPPSRRKSKGGLVHVFLETGKNLKITQTDYGLFISFDRAVVEEYRFGEKRAINVGPVVAQRVSGWEGDSYVIETLDREGVILTERYRLGNDGQSLVREIVVVSKEKRQLDVAQVFDRL